MCRIFGNAAWHSQHATAGQDQHAATKRDGGLEEQQVNRNAAFVGLALLGWAICGSTIAVGRQFLSMPDTLLVHAIVAPIVFALLSTHFFSRYPAASPLGTSLGFVGIVVGLDAFVVAPLIEHSYAMFTRPLGTWIPFASIWLSSFLVGYACQQRQARHRRQTRRA
jgi:succinate-acetate transporter protein